MTLKAAIPLDAVRVHLQASEYADALSYTSVDLTGVGSDVTTAIVGLFDPTIDVEADTIIETGIELVIGNGLITRATMATDGPDGLFGAGEVLTAAGGGTGTYAGQAQATLYYRATAGVFGASELVTGADGSTWTLHGTPALALEGVVAPKAGDRFVWRGYRWQILAVDNEHGPGTFLLAAQRGALSP